MVWIPKQIIHSHFILNNVPVFIMRYSVCGYHSEMEGTTCGSGNAEWLNLIVKHALAFLAIGDIAVDESTFFRFFEHLGKCAPVR